MNRGNETQKNFPAWLDLKTRIDAYEHKAPLVNVGDIWWASVGENVGREISGKSDKFTRPVIIYKKLAHAFYLVIPTTTKPKEGSWFVHFMQNEVSMNACLHQIRTIDHRRLYSKIGRLDDEDTKRIKEGFLRLYN